MIHWWRTWTKILWTNVTVNQS